MKHTQYLCIFTCILFSTLFTWAQPTIFLIGDSTMSNKKNSEINPERGWGQMLPQYFLKEINIENHAKNGRSTKSFIDEGRWLDVKKNIKPGDYVFIQFGHNDSKAYDPTRYVNPLTGYRSNLQHFVLESRALGAMPVLFTSVARRNFNEDGVLVDTHGLYPLMVHQLANELDVMLIDLQLISEQLILAFGLEDSKKMYLHFAPGEHPYYPDGKSDNTHFSAFGASLIAQKVVQDLAKMDVLTAYILTE